MLILCVFNMGKNQSKASTISGDMMAQSSRYASLTRNYAIVFFENSPFPLSLWSKQGTIGLGNQADLNAHKFLILFPCFRPYSFENGRNITFWSSRYVFSLCWRHIGCGVRPQTRKKHFEIGSLLCKDAMLLCRSKSLVHLSWDGCCRGGLRHVFIVFIFDYYSVCMKDHAHKGLWVN